MPDNEALPVFAYLFIKLSKQSTGETVRERGFFWVFSRPPSFFFFLGYAQRPRGYTTIEGNLFEGKKERESLGREKKRERVGKEIARSIYIFPPRFFSATVIILHYV